MEATKVHTPTQKGNEKTTFKVISSLFACTICHLHVYFLAPKPIEIKNFPFLKKLGTMLTIMSYYIRI